MKYLIDETALNTLLSFGADVVLRVQHTLEASGKIEALEKAKEGIETYDPVNNTNHPTFKKLAGNLDIPELMALLTDRQDALLAEVEELEDVRGTVDELKDEKEDLEARLDEINDEWGEKVSSIIDDLVENVRIAASEAKDEASSGIN